MDELNKELDELRISFWLWFKSLLVPWISRHWAIWATPLLLGVAIAAAYMQAWHHSPTWWLSLSLQVIGLMLSASALMAGALEMKVDGPLKTLKLAALEFPRYRRPRIQYGYANLKMPSFRAYGSARVSPAANASDQERIDFLLRSLELLEQTSRQLFRKIEDDVERVAGRVESLEITTSQKQIEIEKQIRGISVGNFYQVLLGLAFLSAGSIASLFF